MPRLRPFKVPWALDASGMLQKAEDVGSGVYRCVECLEALVLRRGPTRRVHFAHRGSSTSCSQESVFHKLAKELIVQSVRQWRTGGPVPRLRRQCTAGVDWITSVVPDRVVDAESERRLGSGRVVDVALLDEDGMPICAIEVLYTHAVDAVKRAELDIPWLEVRALDILADPLLWNPTQHALRPYTCAQCKREDAILQFATMRAPRARLEDDAVLNDFLEKAGLGGRDARTP